MTSTASDRAAGRVPPPNRRERARAAMLDEIKQTALDLMREQGSADVRFADIARAMGLTAPALYRYYADRDELLTAMLVDSFDHLSAHVAAALEAAPADDLGARLFAACTGYRRWASANPQRFALLFGTPVPGYAAPEAGPTLQAALRAMANLQDVVLAAMERGELSDPLVKEVGPAVIECAGAKAALTGKNIPPATYQGMMHIWTTLHGFTCLEVYGQFQMEPEARDEIFAVQIRAAAISAGLPPPRPLAGWPESA